LLLLLVVVVGAVAVAVPGFLGVGFLIGDDEDEVELEVVEFADEDRFLFF
jgi:hypothetical protein